MNTGTRIAIRIITVNTRMKEFCFTVTKTGYIHVEADSLEDAEARLQESFGHYYVITETGEELSNGWETTGEVEEDPEY